MIVSCLGLACIPVLLGNPLYEFYRVWSWRVTGGRLSASSGHALLRLAPTIAAALLLSLKPRTYHRACLTVAVVICAVSLLASGSLLLGLEKGAKPSTILPFTLHALHTATYSAASPLFVMLTAVLPPPHRRPSVLSAVIASVSLLRLASRALLPYLIRNLHPFGLFWLHASLSILSVLYLLVVIFPRFKTPSTSRDLPLNPIDKDESS